MKVGCAVMLSSGSTSGQADKRGDRLAGYVGTNSAAKSNAAAMRFKLFGLAGVHACSSKTHPDENAAENVRGGGRTALFIALIKHRDLRTLEPKRERRYI